MASSISGLTFKLHPLVIVNVSDHYTRVKSEAYRQQLTAGTNASTSSSSPSSLESLRVFGCVIGTQTGRTVEIFNSFELLYDPQTDFLDRAFLLKKEELYKKVSPNFYILGWYSTGSDARESDMQIHKALMDINESPVYVLLNPTITHAPKDLPVSIYESELHVIDGIPQLIFVRATYTIETVEAERISVDHVAHLKLSDGGSAATQLAAHLTGVHSEKKPKPKPKKVNSAPSWEKKVFFHGTTIMCFWRPKEVRMTCDSRRSCHELISSDCTTKVHTVGKSILYGESGDCAQNDRIREELKRYVAKKELWHGIISLEEVAREACDIYQRIPHKDRKSYNAVICGFEGDDVPGCLWKVNECAYWPEKGMVCIGSGSMYTLIFAYAYHPLFPDVSLDEITDKSMFTASVNDFATGDVVRVSTMRTDNVNQSVTVSCRTNTVDQLMSKYGFHFDQHSKDNAQAASLYVQHPRRALQTDPRLNFKVASMASATPPVSRCPVMVGLQLDKAVILLVDQGLNLGQIRCCPDGYRSILISHHLGLVGIGGDDNQFRGIVNVIKQNLSRSDLTSQPLQDHAEKAYNFLKTPQLNRFQHPCFLIGGYDQPKSRLPPRSSLWCVTKAGCYPIKDSLCRGCPFAEFTVRTKFDPSLPVENAKEIGLTALNNKHANCIVIELPRRPSQKARYQQNKWKIKDKEISKKRARGQKKHGQMKLFAF